VGSASFEQLVLHRGSYGTGGRVGDSGGRSSWWRKKLVVQAAARDEPFETHSSCSWTFSLSTANAVFARWIASSACHGPGSEHQVVRRAGRT